MSKGKARGFQAGEGRRTKPHGGVTRQRSLKDVNFSIFQLMSSSLSLPLCLCLPFPPPPLSHRGSFLSPNGQRDAPVGVEDGPARRLARHGFVQDGGKVLARLQRRVEGRDGDDGPGSLDPGRGPGVPREADAWEDREERVSAVKPTALRRGTAGRRPRVCWPA